MRTNDPNERALSAREIDRMSTMLIDAGIRVVKKNPIPVGAYIIGILICLFFNGTPITDTQRDKFDLAVSKIDYSKSADAFMDLQHAQQKYYRTKGWFTCNDLCQIHKREVNDAQRVYDMSIKEEQKYISEAKASVGIFSSYGVSETRELFWSRFDSGKEFAKRQTKWDALFLGMRAMGRDESLVQYLLRLLMNMLFNFTLGVIGAVVTFIFSVYSLIRTYQANILVAITFFGLASLSACAFAVTWLVGLYVVAAGSSYVGLKLIASNMRIEGGPGRERHRVN